MPLTRFVDKELADELDKLPKKKEKDVPLEEHLFIANCLKMGLRLNDLKELEYKDVAKIMVCYMEKDEKEGKRKATQSDWDRLAGRR